MSPDRPTRVERMGGPKPSPSENHDVLEDLGARLEARRRHLKKSAREVAEAAGISAVYLRVIETGLNPKTGRASRPSPEIIVRLARALDTPPDALLSLAGYRDLHVDAVPERVGSSETQQPYRAELDDVADALELLRTRPSDFMRAVGAEDLAQFQAHIAALAAGSLLCSPQDDARVRRLALTSACGVMLRAISCGDDDWWLGPHGTDFIELHASLARTSPSAVTRIFLLAPSEQRAYANVFALHAAIGAEVLVADPSGVPETSRRDLEIYDHSLLREAMSAAPPEGRFAEFTDDPSRLRRAEVAFAAAQRVARPPLTS